MNDGLSLSLLPCCVSTMTVSWGTPYWEKNVPMSFEPEGWNYEQKAEFRYAHLDYLRDLLHLGCRCPKAGDWSGKRVLEIGCGAGIDAVTLAKQGAIITATDFTERAVKLTRALFAETGLTAVVPGMRSAASAWQADACDLPFEAETFDVVYSFGVLHHIPDVDVVLQEAKRVLRPGGKMIAMLYNQDSLLYAYSILLRGLKEGLAPGEALLAWSERIPGCPYTKVYTEQSARELFGKYFSQVTVDIEYPVVDLPTERKVKLTDAPRELGWHLLVRAKK